MLNKKNNITNLMMALKIILFMFILLSPLVNFQKHLSFMNSTVVKILLILVICIVCFIDFQLAILATIAFLILVISLNKNLSTMITKDSFMNNTPPSRNLLDDQFSPPMQTPKSNGNLVCGTHEVTSGQMNKEMLSHFIDDKIKPYDVFISMMTDEKALARAQGAIID